MSESSAAAPARTWRAELPVLAGRRVALREPTLDDSRAVEALLSLHDATRFGFDDPIDDAAVRRFLERLVVNRTQGRAIVYLMTIAATGEAAGLFQVRALDPAFEAGEWECTIAPSARGTGAFVEAARLLGSFVFDTVGAYRLEARVLLQNGRSNGALRKLGAVQEGVLRHSLRRDGRYFDQVLWSILREDWQQSGVSTAPRVH